MEKSKMLSTENTSGKSNLKKIMDTIIAIIDYVIASVFVVVFALFCSGRVGWFLLLVLYLAPIISVLYALFFRRKIDVSMKVSGDTILKSSYIDLDIFVSNLFFLPSPILELELLDNDHIETKHTAVVTALLPKERRKISFKLTALVCGGSYVGIKSIKVKDYFGLVSFKVMEDEELSEYVCRVGIIPNLLTDFTDDNLMQEMMAQSFGDGDCEETIDDTSYSFFGTPGYEYREYVPGDPIKRINSKMSAKRDKLYVRLDEKNAMSNISIVLDPMLVLGENDSGAHLAENAIEYTLFMIYFLICKDFAVKFYLYSSEIKNFDEYIITDESTLNMLLNVLAFYIFDKENSDVRRIPDNTVINRQSVIVCTTSEKSYLSDGDVFASKDVVESLGVYDVSLGEGRRIC